MAHQRTAWALVLALASASGCGPAVVQLQPGGTDTAAGSDTPDPWLDLEPVALDPWRGLVRTTLMDAQTATRMAHLPAVPLTFVLDESAGAVWVLDSRYRHDPTPRCIDLDVWPELDPDGDRQEGCHEGAARVRRGVLTSSSLVVAVATEPVSETVWLLDDGGRLSRASASPTLGNPLDFLRTSEVAQLHGPGPGPYRMAADGGGGLVYADGSHLRWLNGEGTELARLAVPVSDLTVENGVAWALEDAGLHWWDGSSFETAAAVDGTAGRLADGWVSLPAEGLVATLDMTVQVQIDDLTGPIASRNGRTWVAVESGVVLIEDGAEVARHSTDPVVDLVVQDTGEVAILHDDDTVAVYGDETALGENPALQLALLTYLENPKDDDSEDDACEGSKRTLDSVITLARKNRQLLDDLPGISALGIIPHVAELAIECGRVDDLPAIWDGDAMEPGLFFYEDQPEEVADTEDLAGLLSAQGDLLTAAGVPFSWTRGAERYEGDWVAGLEASGLPLTVMAPDLTIWPEIVSDDPRSKDPWPWYGATARTAWTPAETDTEVRVWPGLSISAFDLSGCPNTWIRECKQLNLGGGHDFDEADMAVLGLDLFRALSARTESGPDHWSFHLPALGVYDYTENCAQDDRFWSGDTCMGAVLQDFMLDVHARYISAGVAAWRPPGG